MLTNPELLLFDEKHDTIEAAAVSVEIAKRLADHYLAIAQYWRQVAHLPPVLTATGQRRLDTNYRPPPPAT